MKNPYKVLGIRKGCSESEARSAFSKMALRYHPDRKQGSEVKFREISEAYDRIKSKRKPSELDIAGFEAHYRGSEEEIAEIKSLYNKFKGDICKIIDNMVIGRDEDEERVREYVKGWIANGEAAKYPRFDKRIKDNKRRLAARAREADVAANVDNGDKKVFSRGWEDFLSGLEAKYGRSSTKRKK